jgi:hypothetical protein
MSCERNLEASLLLDGELPPSDAATAVEHLLGCADCRQLFRRGRALDAALLFAAAEEGAAVGDSAPPEVWERIGAEVGESLRPAAVAEFRGRRRPRPAWLLPLAATLLVGLGASVGWLARSGAPRATQLLAEPARPGDFATVATSGAPAPGTTPGAAGAEMTEERFVAIARELLSSDRRYRDAMAGVLVVADSAEPREGSTAESSWRQEELQDLQPEAGGSERSRPDGARLY